MIVLGRALAVAVLAAQSPAADTLRHLAAHLSETALVSETRARPTAVREAVSVALAKNELDAARNLAAAYALAWSDSFLVREVARFASWPAERRVGKVWTDSVRRVGVAVYARDGPDAAIGIWQRALTRATAVDDSAGVASITGNIGAALAALGQADSAGAYLRRAQSLAEALGDLRVQANADVGLAGLEEDRSDVAAARASYGRALALQERIGDTRGLAASYNNLGLIAENMGDPDEARRQFEAALALNRRDGRDDVAATNLVNLAGLSSQAGDYARAERLNRDALATWRSHGQWAEAASALHGLGQLEMRRGDYTAAVATLDEALSILDRTGPPGDAIALRRELAGALTAKGDMQGALDQLRRAQRSADATRAPAAVRAGLALARADYAVQLNALADAERLYSRAEYLYRQSGDAGGEAEAQVGRGLLFLERENYPRAQALLENALRTESVAGRARAAALTRLWLGRVALQGGDTAQARSRMARAVTDLEQIGDPVGVAAALAERAELEAAAGSPVLAESLLRAGLDRVGKHLAPEVTWRLHAGLGLALRARGNNEEAALEFRSALADVDRPARSLALAERRSAYLADKWDVYAQLALTEGARGLSSAAFVVSERMRAREMLELMSRGRVAAPGDSSADLIEREQDLRGRIAELTSQVEAPASGTEDLRGPYPPRANQAALGALQRAQDDYAELLLEVRERAPRYVDLVAREAVTWQDVAHRLGATEAFLEYLTSDSGSLAFVVTRDTLAMVKLGVPRRDLARLVTLARAALQPQGSPRTDSLWRGPLSQLRQYLVTPIEETHLLAGKTRLVIAPHEELHYLPFAALPERDGRFLIERFDVILTPSASVWMALGDRRADTTAAGILAFAPRLEPLPASRREVGAIAQLAGAQVLSGGAASEAAFRREAPTRRVLHLASYGVLNKQNPLFSFVELTPGGTQDGRLEVHEVFGLHLAADLVVLSACQTGVASGSLADVPTGDDWVGLTRAFLHAGARNVVATLWPVDDWATAALMERFYQGYGAGAEPVNALARAQRALLAQPATSHPFYWAGFVSVGGASPGKHQ